jgi:hypothetical protein
VVLFLPFSRMQFSNTPNHKNSPTAWSAQLSPKFKKHFSRTSGHLDVNSCNMRKEEETLLRLWNWHHSDPTNWMPHNRKFLIDHIIPTTLYQACLQPTTLTVHQ